MATVDAQLAVLKHARDAADGVTYLARDVGLGADFLDAMLQEREPIPEWVFLRVMDYLIQRRYARGRALF
jgi:hypothetical protein